MVLVATLAIASCQRWGELKQLTAASLESRRIEELAALEALYMAQQGSKANNAAQELEKLSNLALVSWQLGHFMLAETALRQAVFACEKNWGADDPHAAVYLATLASVCRDDGKQSEAQAFAKKALEIDVKAFGEYSPHVARDLDNLALLYQFDAMALGDPARKEELLSRSKACLEKSEHVRKEIAR